MKIISANDEMGQYLGYVVNANTILYLKNNGDIKDYSSYNHTMQRRGTAVFETLSNGRKVANFSGSSQIYSNTFSETMNKTTFTLHCWVKMKSGTTEDNIVGWCGRNISGTSTSDRWGLRLQRDSGYSTYYILAGPNSSNWVSLGPSGINPGTSEFCLMTATVNGGTYKLYKNGVLYGSWTSSTIRGGSNTGTRFYIGGAVYSDGSKRSSTLSYAYVGETVLEDKTETDAEVLEFYNKTKKNYV